MVGTICSVVGGDRSGVSRKAMSLAFLAASIIAATALGFAIGIAALPIGSGWRDAIAVGVVLVSIAAALRELGVASLGVPALPRQVPWAWWYRHNRLAVSAAWGAQLGAGVVTRLNSAGFYAVVAATIWLGSPVKGAIIFGLYGLVRGIEPIVVYQLNPSRPGDVIMQLRGYAEVIARTCAISCLCVGAVVSLHIAAG
jgi:hypothetical protein